MRLQCARGICRPGKDRETRNGAGEQVKRSARQCRAMWQLDQTGACRQINGRVAVGIVPYRVDIHPAIGNMIARGGEYPAHCGVMLHRQSRSGAGQGNGKRRHIAQPIGGHMAIGHERRDDLI